MNLYATITDQRTNLEAAAKCINNGRTDGTYFYVNGNSVSVANPHYQIKECEQRNLLCWFLQGRQFFIA